MMCDGQYELKLPIYEKFMELNKCVRTKGILENILMYLYYAFQFHCDECLHYIYKI